VLRVDRARCVILRGHYLNHGLHPYQEEKPFTFLDSHLLDQEGRTLLKFEGYGVMTASKWLAHPGVVQKIVQRKFDEITPVTSQISPSLRCTNACPMCSYAQTKDSLLQAAHRADLEMSDRDMTLTINALCSGGVKGLVFTGGGEPLVNEHTIMGMGLAKNMKMSVGLFTNGVLLNDKAAARIVSIDPSFVRVSLNAGTSDAYAAVHGCDSHDTFQTVLANIRSLAEQKLATQARFHLDIGVLITPFCLDTPTCVGRPHECH
jgi:organic radical activating enzyme